MYGACAVLSSVGFPALHISSTLSHKEHDLKKKLLYIKLCFDFLYKGLSEKILILRRNERDIIVNVHWSSYQVPVFLIWF